jgi:L-fucose mutarotase
MLKNLNPILSPDLLQILRAMGHGDRIAIVDGNYPAEAHAERLVRLDGLTATAVLDAILSVMPLDPPEFAPASAWRMQVVGAPDARQPIFDEFEALLVRHEGPAQTLASFERFAFYDTVKTCFAVVTTGESRLYGNIILQKGVIKPA